MGQLVCKGEGGGLPRLSCSAECVKSTSMNYSCSGELMLRVNGPLLLAKTREQSISPGFCGETLASTTFSL